MPGTGDRRGVACGSSAGGEGHSDGSGHQQRDRVRDVRKVKVFLRAELCAVTVVAHFAGRG